MKKSAALKLVPPDQASILAKLERLNLYYISLRSFFESLLGSGGKDTPKVPVMLTHFYPHGIKFKVLIKSDASGFIHSHNGYYSIRYHRLDRYKIEPMSAEDLPLFAGQAHPHMSDAFKRAKPFKKLKERD